MYCVYVYVVHYFLLLSFGNLLSPPPFPAYQKLKNKEKRVTERQEEILIKKTLEINEKGKKSVKGERERVKKRENNFFTKQSHLFSVTIL